MKINIRENVSLAPFTTFKIGGAAKFFCEVENEDELIEAVEYAKKNNLKVFVLGGGSNILVSDEGFNGLVIQMLNISYFIHNTSIECGAGLPLSQAVKLAVENELTGLEWAAGIPGTVGGAVRGNAGAYGFDMSEISESVKTYCHSRVGGNPVLINQKSKIITAVAGSRQGGKNQNDNLKFKIFENKNCKFDYRDSIFKQNSNLIILSCVLKLQKGDKVEIENKIKEVIKKRTEKLPKEPSPGSFFQNPVVKNLDLIARFERDTSCQCRENKIPAGWLIEEVGLRGKKIGGVMVSEKHANFVVNLGEGTAEEVVMLASLIKMKVRDALGVELREEIQYVGF